MTSLASPSGSLRVLAPTTDADRQLLTPGALEFLEGLLREFSGRRDALLARRDAVQATFDAGARPDFLEETKSVREGTWTVAPIPADLQDRRVEITGPVDRKMVINALNSGANCYMADFEDSTAPTWRNLIEGQRNLFDAVRRQIDFRDEARGKNYALGTSLATLLVRPRGLHLPEAHLALDGEEVCASLVDFGLYFYHNAPVLLGQGSGPYFYLPKLQSHLEARWWNDVFVYAQERMGVPQGSIRATVLIETLPAAFEMDEILWELRDHSAGLNCGRWDYIFSYIKTLRNDPTAVLPDRAQVGMTQPNMRAYTTLAVKTCHRRGVHAMGGMAAQIPIKSDAGENERALAKVKADKEREAADGHDGTWVAHPALVSIAREAFSVLTGPNQIENKRDDVQVSAADLLAVPAGTRTQEGLRQNIRVGVQYLEAWLRGSGCVPLYHLMEDAATAEISRSQVWQWLRHEAQLADGTPVTSQRFEQALEAELDVIRAEVGDNRYESGKFAEAAQMFAELSTAETLVDFLTLPAYRRLITKTQ